MLECNIKAASFYGVILPPVGNTERTEALQTCLDISKTGLLNLPLQHEIGC